MISKREEARRIVETIVAKAADMEMREARKFYDALLDMLGDQAESVDDYITSIEKDSNSNGKR
jgi:hypothetical protein